MALSPGTKLGPYEILASIGAGGMGEVYRAKDTRLNREVAVKVLPSRLARDEDALARFEREAKAVATISHPNVLAVYDVGSEEGIAYLVMELLEGETLRERIQSAPISWRKALEYSIAIADGLAAAHAKGVIHRDLKPENIFLTSDGVVKILDFGLARTYTPSTPNGRTITLGTTPGTILGTVNYMSPEQIRGGTLDGRSDVFSFACVLYEMLTRRRAFSSDTAPETMTAILNGQSPELSESGVDTQPGLDQVISRCLEKKPEHRFQSAQDLSFTLKNILSGSGRAAAMAPNQPKFMRIVVGATAAAVLVMLVGFAYLMTTRNTSVSAPRTIASLAVLPFENLSKDPEQEYFSDGMTEALIFDLAKISALKVISRTSVMRYRGSNLPLPEVAGELGVDAVIEGSVLRFANQVRITVRLVDGVTEKHLWGATYERTNSDVLAMQSEIARDVAKQVQVTLTPQERVEFTRSEIVDPTAHEDYMHGRYYMRAGGVESIKRALAYFDKAVERDPNYALAWAGKSEAHRTLSSFYLPPLETMPKAKAAALRSLELDNTLAEAHVAMANYQLEHAWDWTAAEEGFKHALELKRSLPEAHLGYARLLVVLGRNDEALAHLNLAREYDPVSVVASEDFGLIYYMAREFDLAIEYSRKAISLDSNHWWAHAFLGLSLAQKGEFDEAIAELQEALRLNENPATLAQLGAGYALAGKFPEAVATINALAKMREERYVCPYRTAWIYVALQDFDRAFESLETACSDRSDCMPFLNADVQLDPIRDDPRFDALLICVGLESGTQAITLAPGQTDAIKIAVIPFEDMSPEAHEWFADGMTDSVISDLASVSGLRVTSLTSVLRYKNAKKSVGQIARELGVEMIVEGSVVQAGDRVRISARLIEGATGRMLWTNRYEKDATNILGLQREVAREIAQEVGVQLTPQEEEHFANAPVVDPRAHEAYLKGRYQLQLASEEAFDRAVELFNKSIRIDPSYALGYVGLARAHMRLSSVYRAPLDTAPKAKKAALRAIGLDDTLSDAHRVLSNVRLFHDWDWDAAESEARRAIDLNPSSAGAHLEYANYLAAMGRSEEAIVQIGWTLELDPLVLISDFNFLTATFMSHRYDLVVRYSRQAIDMNPDVWFPHTFLGLAQQQNGNLAEAIAALERGRELENNPISAAMLGGAYAEAGRRDDAERILADLDEQEKVRYICPYEVATVYIYLEQKDEAFEEFDQACQDRSDCLAWLQADPRLDPIRDDERFEQLLRRVGFTPPNSPVPLVEAPGVKVMLVVLPFEDMSPTPQEWFVDGMTDEMITTLGRLSPKKLGVIARTSAMHYKNTRRPIERIGYELNVDYVVEGAVRRASGRVRISAKLIQVSDQTQLWADSYERDLADVFKIQVEVAEAIAQSLAVELLPQSKAAQSKPATNSSAAYDAYLLGRSYWAKRTPKALYTAIEHFNRAVDLDPDYALAYAGLSDTWGVLPYYVPGPYNRMNSEAKKAAERAFALDPSLAEANVSMAFVLTHASKLELAEQHYRKAIAIDSNNATAYQWYGQVLVLQGHLERAATAYEKAIALDPLSAVMRLDYGWGMRLARRWDEAIEQLDIAKDIQPDLRAVAIELMWAHIGKADHASATSSFENWLTLIGQPPKRIAKFRRSFEAYGLKKALAEWTAEFDDETSLPHNAFVHAEYLAWCGETDRAFKWLERAIQHQDPLILSVQIDAGFDNLRSDPRYDEFLKQLKTVE